LWNGKSTCPVHFRYPTQALDNDERPDLGKPQRDRLAHLHADADGQASQCLLGRQHWSIENSLHFVRDVIMQEDASRIRRQPGTFARLRSWPSICCIAKNSIKFTLPGKQWAGMQMPHGIA
jgi:hypothetical protein